MVICGDATQKQCFYRTFDGKHCDRPVCDGGNFCSLHFGSDRKLGDEEVDNDRFERDFATLVSSSNGDWQGFVFPRGVTFPKHFDFPINARGCRFSALDLSHVVFKGSVDFTGAVFEGSTSFRSVEFGDTVTFNGCQFYGAANFLQVLCKRTTSFYRATFTERSILKINFRGSANFNETIFRDGVSFSGWRNVTVSADCVFQFSGGGFAAVSSIGRKPTFDERCRMVFYATKAWLIAKEKQVRRQVNDLSKEMKTRYRSFQRQFAKTDSSAEISRMFETDGQLQDVVFLRPDQTIFSQVDLSHVYLRGTNLRGARFLGVNWWQEKLGRNGLYDELFIRLSKDGPFRHQELPVLEETCRNARVALEENRSFNAASDFYLGELEAARAQLGFLKRHLFSVNALYRTVSRYGTSVEAALGVLVLLYLLHFVLTVAIQYDGAVLSVEGVSMAALRSFTVLMQQTPDSLGPSEPLSQRWIDVFFRVLGLAQVAMVALAFRSRIKRH